jgi:hypothetical protein
VHRLTETEQHLTERMNASEQRMNERFDAVVAALDRLANPPT